MGSKYKKTLQRTQYYPSGLPIVSNPGDNPGIQARKYNGKEFVEMHGYDTYDYGARGYYPAMGKFMTVDPLAEKYYSISPYDYCAGSPVKYIDPDGKQVFLGLNTPFSPLFSISDQVILSNKPVVTETMSRVARTTTETSSTGGKEINIERINAGCQAETEQLQKLGLEKNTESFTRVDPKTGKDVTTIPDGFKNGQTTEIKNLGEGQKQSLTEQLRAQKELSNENGTNPQLHISKEAGLTKPLQNAGFDVTRFNIVPPSQNSGVQTQSQKQQ